MSQRHPNRDLPDRRFDRRLSRRRFLGGAGTLVALPFLEALAPSRRALAQAGDAAPATSEAGAPVRVFTYFAPNGMHMPAWTPEAAGPDYELTPILASLEPHRSELLILSGLANHVSGANDAPHTWACGTMLTGVPIVKHPGGQVTSGTSFDQVGAKALEGLTRYPSLEVSADEGSTGFCEDGYSCAYLQSLSWAGPELPLPSITDPKALFDHLFAGWDPTATAQEQAWRKAERKSILDFVWGQAKDLGPSLSVADGARMEQYLEAISALEKSLAALPDEPPTGVCAESEAPGPTYGIQMRLDALHELMVLALQCDQTRILTFMLENGLGSRYYDFLGVSAPHHSLTHHFGDEDMIADVITIDTWEVQQLASLLERMREVDEGDGTLLDHTALVFTSSMSNGNGHDPHDLPVLLAGRAGGAIDPGRHVIYEGSPSRSNLWIALLGMVGVEVESFGTHGTGPLGGLGT